MHSAMPTSKALRLCPQAIVIPPRLGFYAEVSEQILAIFDRYTPLVEPECAEYPPHKSIKKQPARRTKNED